jgi:hypothetical protein
MVVRYDRQINPVRIVENTSAYVTLEGEKRRRARISGWESIYPTLAEAVVHVRQAQTRKRDVGRRMVEEAQAVLDQLDGAHADGA